MYDDRIKQAGLREKIITAHQAACLFENNMVVVAAASPKLVKVFHKSINADEVMVTDQYLSEPLKSYTVLHHGKEQN